MLRQDNYQRHNAGDILFTWDDQLYVPKIISGYLTIPNLQSRLKKPSGAMLNR